jgi:hypothetical protein
MALPATPALPVLPNIPVPPESRSRAVGSPLVEEAVCNGNRHTYIAPDMLEAQGQRMQKGTEAGVPQLRA